MEEEQNSVIQNTVSTNSTEAPPTIQMPAATAVAPKSFPIVPILVAIVILLFITIIFLVTQNKQTTDIPVSVIVTPTIAASPTPIRKASALSETEAFKSFSNEKASFSAEINNFSFQEGLFTPPILELELGITN